MAAHPDTDLQWCVILIIALETTHIPCFLLSAFSSYKARVPNNPLVRYANLQLEGKWYREGGGGRRKGCIVI